MIVQNFLDNALSIGRDNSSLLSFNDIWHCDITHWLPLYDLSATGELTVLFGGNHNRFILSHFKFFLDWTLIVVWIIYIAAFFPSIFFLMGKMGNIYTWEIRILFWVQHVKLSIIKLSLTYGKLGVFWIVCIFPV